MARKLAVVASVNPYNAPPRGSHYWARWLTRQGYKVAYLSAPISPFHVGATWSAELKGRVRTWADGGHPFGKDIVSYVPAALAPPKDLPLPGFASDLLHRHWHRTTVPPLSMAHALKPFRRPDLFYCDDPIFAGLADHFESPLTIFRVIDSLDAHKRNYTVQGGLRGRMKAAAHLAARADLTVYASRTYEDDIAALNPRRMAFLPNGYEAELFDPAKSSQVPVSLDQIPGPRAVYVGELSQRIDWSLLEALADAMPSLNIVLIGFMTGGVSPDDLAALLRRPNVHFLGQRAYVSLPRYLQGCDVGLIPFRTHKEDRFAEHSNPLKLYQYLAMGLPVVASRTKGLETIGAPIALTDGAPDFMGQVARAISAGRNAGYYERRRFAVPHAFDATLDALFDAHPECDPRDQPAIRPVLESPDAHPDTALPAKAA